MTTLASQLEELLESDGTGIVRVPALVKGELRFPPRIPAPDEAYVVEKPTWSNPGGSSTLMLPRVDPAEVLETDPALLARTLYRLPFSELLAYVSALRAHLLESLPAVRSAVLRTSVAGSGDRQLIALVGEVIPHLLDPDLLGEAVDRELGSMSVPGREFLDGWVQTSPEPQRGMTARMGDQIFRSAEGSIQAGSKVRALPTRQLHITAGNSPIIPLLSLLRGLATRSAVVVKSAADETAVMAILAVAMHSVDPDHPITKHTSLVYWKGGDRSVEDVLFRPGAFDRLLVWGSSEAVRSVAERAHHTKVVSLQPRYGLSLIGRQAFPDGVSIAAKMAVTDSMISNQRACTSSLVHYVEGSEEQALEYCRAVKDALAQWDRVLPQQVPPATQGKLRMLKRTTLLNGQWFESGSPLQTTSAVVYMPDEFDLSCHPMCRLIVVRRVPEARDALRYLNSSVSAVGVYPETLRLDLRDEIAACGVSNIFPLGECERSYAGMPHDGMKLLSELVNWTNA